MIAGISVVNDSCAGVRSYHQASVAQCKQAKQHYQNQQRQYEQQESYRQQRNHQSDYSDGSVIDGEYEVKEDETKR